MSAFRRELATALSPYLLLGIIFFVYRLLHRFDWGFPFVKLFCFAVLAFLVTLLHRWSPGPVPRKGFQWAEFGILLVVLVAILAIAGKRYGPGIAYPPQVDIGIQTVNSIGMLVNEQRNPYSSDQINQRDDLAPEHRGFHYGPLMLLGYLPSAYFPNSGYKVMSALYVLVTVGVVWLLLRLPGQSTEDWLSSGVFAMTALFLSARLWWEILHQGANDIFPVCLLFLSLLALKKQQLLWAGVFVGLSFAAKFAPAVFLMILFLRRNLSFTYLKGVAIGLIPLIAFAMWDPAGLFNNVFEIRFTMRHDSTSLYSRIPPELYFIFPLTLLTATAIMIWRNFRRPLELENVVVDFTVLLTIAAVTYKKVHANHLIWFFPLWALIFARYRYRLVRPALETFHQILRGPSTVSPP